MNWQQAIEILSQNVAKRHNIPVSAALKDAVKEGLMWECDAWVNQSK